MPIWVASAFSFCEPCYKQVHVFVWLSIFSFLGISMVFFMYLKYRQIYRTQCHCYDTVLITVCLGQTCSQEDLVVGPSY